MFVNDEVEWIRKEAVVTCMKFIHEYLLGATFIDYCGRPQDQELNPESHR
jgi:hypothetical protein